MSAADRGGIDLARSFMVGDKWSDLDFGIRLGIPSNRCFLVLTGHGEEEIPLLADKPKVSVAPNLVGAVQKILNEL